MQHFIPCHRPGIRLRKIMTLALAYLAFAMPGRAVSPFAPLAGPGDSLKDMTISNDPVDTMTVSRDSLAPYRKYDFDFFRAGCYEGDNFLEWKIADLHSFIYYEVEVSRDGELWKTIYSAPIPDDQNRFKYQDRAALSHFVYVRIRLKNRIKSVTSPLQKITCRESDEYLQVAPNPSRGQLNIGLHGHQQDALVQIVNFNSVIVREFTVEPMDHLVPISGLEPGNYVLRVLMNDNLMFRRIVVY